MAARKSGLPLMNYLRVQVDAVPLLNHRSPLRILPNFFLRRFSEEVRSSFLDKSEVTDRVISCIKKFEKIDDPSQVIPTAHFISDLGLDSLDAIEICMALDEEFGFKIPDNEAVKILSVNQAVDLIASLAPAK